MGLTYASHCWDIGETAQRVVFEKRCVPTQGSAHVAVPDEIALHAAVHDLDPPMADWLRENRLLIDPLLDYEVELGLALLEDVDLTRLADRSWTPRIGFFIANDVTARAVQICGEGSHDRQRFWSAAKSFAGFLPVSERYWTPDSPSVDGLLADRLETRVNDGLRQSASTLDLMWTVPDILRIVCEATGQRTLTRDTWILTGTPAGVTLKAKSWQRRMLAALPRRLAVRLALTASSRKSAFLRPDDKVDCHAKSTKLTTDVTVV